ncbi:hypothetical protein CONLIGDRAFT_684976 [Coniochaeta ligniaria NRRL 30616]|uniref:Uncharacterized protein n=1 Tax=Coniochaeta ligniaria NRRL 30616 TaxID=1408157 RepID=A0A1J7IVH5_9PEZI|nr:hypothetical protein CONLIGDRAFT_684976 [Coniochaeta ligniaria NRRL 30616]
MGRTIKTAMKNPDAGRREINPLAARVARMSAPAAPITPTTAPTQPPAQPPAHPPATQAAPRFTPAVPGQGFASGSTARALVAQEVSNLA